MLMSGSAIRPPFGSRASVSNMRSTSAGSRTAARIRATEKDGAATSTGRRNRSANRVKHKRHARDARRGLLERLQPFGSDRELEAGEAGDIAAGIRQVRYETLADRIDHLRKHDWHGRALLPQ